jgi:2-keto-3-deoxy-6-phosphogluconate aldolase
MKNINVTLDKPYAVPAFASINGSQSNQALIGTGSLLAQLQRRLRLGGRLK